MGVSGGPRRTSARGQTVHAVRAQIDRVDAQVLRVLNQRARLVLRVGRLKQRQGRKLVDPPREAAILRGLTRANRGPLSGPALRAIYREVLRQFRRLQVRSRSGA